MKNGILFDLDGTLCDASIPIVQCWNDVFRRKGADKQLSLDDMHRLMGKTLPEIASALFPGWPDAARQNLIQECCEAELVPLKRQGGTLYPLVEETLRTLHRQYSLYIVSNCQDGYIPCFLEAHGLAPLFADWECSGHTGKSKGENIRMVIERNRLDRAVYLGDTLGDQRAAEEAGIPFLHAAYGFGQPDKPVPSLKAFSDLPSLLSYILR